MELKESIKTLKDRIKRNKDCMKAISSQKDNFEEDENYIFFEKDSEAIDTVLEELNNRIPRKDIEDKIEKVRCETTWNYNDWKYDKKVYNAEHNMINIIEKELLNKE